MGDQKYPVQIVCTSPLPDRCTDYLLEMESPASLNLIKLKSQFQKPQNQFRKFILNILFLEPLTLSTKICISRHSPEIYYKELAQTVMEPEKLRPRRARGIAPAQVGSPEKQTSFSGVSSGPGPSPKSGEHRCPAQRQPGGENAALLCLSFCSGFRWVG